MTIYFLCLSTHIHTLHFKKLELLHHPIYLRDQRQHKTHMEKKECGPGIYVEQFFSESYLFPLSPQYLKLLCIHYQQHVK